MRGDANNWLTAFCFSAILHTVFLAAVGYGFCFPSAPEAKQRQYIEVKLTQVVPLQPRAVEDTAAPRAIERVEQSFSRTVSPRKVSVAASPVATVKQGAPVAQAAQTGDVSVASPVSGTNSPGTEAGASSGGGIGDHGPAVIYAPAPAYPRDARTKSWEGTVRVKVLITAAGEVGSAMVSTSSGSNSLDQAAIDCLRTWRFRPAYRDGNPVAVWVIVPVVFKLD